MCLVVHVLLQCSMGMLAAVTMDSGGLVCAVVHGLHMRLLRKDGACVSSPVGFHASCCSSVSKIPQQAP